MKAEFRIDIHFFSAPFSCFAMQRDSLKQQITGFVKLLHSHFPSPSFDVTWNLNTSFFLSPTLFLLNLSNLNLARISNSGSNIFLSLLFLRKRLEHKYVRTYEQDDGSRLSFPHLRTYYIRWRKKEIVASGRESLQKMTGSFHMQAFLLPFSMDIEEEEEPPKLWRRETMMMMKPDWDVRMQGGEGRGGKEMRELSAYQHEEEEDPWSLSTGEENVVGEEEEMYRTVQYSSLLSSKRVFRNKKLQLFLACLFSCPFLLSLFSR